MESVTVNKAQSAEVVWVYLPDDHQRWLRDYDKVLRAAAEGNHRGRWQYALGQLFSMGIATTKEAEDTGLDADQQYEYNQKIWKMIKYSGYMRNMMWAMRNELQSKVNSDGCGTLAQRLYATRISRHFLKRIPTPGIYVSETFNHRL